MEKFSYGSGLRNPEIEAGKEWQARQMREVRDKLAEACDAFLTEAKSLQQQIALLDKIGSGTSAGDLGGEPVYAAPDIARQHQAIRLLEDKVRLLEENIEFQKSLLSRAEENLAALGEMEAEFKERILSEPEGGDLLDISGREN